uniref:Uncharacterized protein n=1 Tax=Chromera velia CCMP2878 TaxID=1169474 RepID=A0A0G4G9U3_9ALVE|mmetsp:Transcript_36022/g.70880  ORF Transcript_36022/g.70880 Transcript_36022/m.70880 type:complete len:240 (+) Transcript_36022:191-910(+)|eukprot:Cvel_587.t1-p1 / transcript=Cvel_587.t1 / gene=Cvel_587 / organism=Chromera_velia_CCMP2878 / gene_product=hypothetical protein / transcript_product=hypothetical protein / location=Cvel_scaffold18:78308-79563(+) / protein_length=239 / sequence_SO=supercontig / SO=protein_coding / is_pseudo=false
MAPGSSDAILERTDMVVNGEDEGNLPDQEDEHEEEKEEESDVDEALEKWMNENLFGTPVHDHAKVKAKPKTPSPEENAETAGLLKIRGKDGRSRFVEESVFRHFDGTPLSKAVLGTDEGLQGVLQLPFGLFVVDVLKSFVETGRLPSSLLTPSQAEELELFCDYYLLDELGPHVKRLKEKVKQQESGPQGLPRVSKGYVSFQRLSARQRKAALEMHDENKFPNSQAVCSSRICPGLPSV